MIMNENLLHSYKEIATKYFILKRGKKVHCHLLSVFFVEK